VKARAARTGRLWNPGVMSSVRSDWATPRKLFRVLDAEFHFTLDACATPMSATCGRFFTDKDSALDQDWTGVVWCNPPYGRVIGKWVEKAYRESRLGATVVCLLPARTDTRWWHAYVMYGEIRFLQGRLGFDDSKRARAPFPSAIVVFRPEGGR
jgi:phage N-6-adenine-methyltransferase